MSLSWKKAGKIIWNKNYIKHDLIKCFFVCKCRELYLAFKFAVMFGHINGSHLKLVICAPLIASLCPITTSSITSKCSHMKIHTQGRHTHEIILLLALDFFFFFLAYFSQPFHLQFRYNINIIEALKKIKYKDTKVKVARDKRKKKTTGSCDV